MIISNPVKLGVLVLAGLVLAGCASYESQTIKTRPISDYDARANVKGVKIAADPYENAERIKSVLYVDTSQKNIRPVHLIVENTSREDVLLVRADMELVDSVGSLAPISAATVVDKFEKNELAYAFWGFGMWSYMSAQKANEKMSADWFKKEFPEEKVLRPNFKASGLVFFETPEHLTSKALRIPLKNLKTDVTRIVEMPLSGGIGKVIFSSEKKPAKKPLVVKLPAKGETVAQPAPVEGLDQVKPTQASQAATTPSVPTAAAAAPVSSAPAQN